MEINLQPILDNKLIRIKPLIEQDYKLLYQVAMDPLIWKQHPFPGRYKRNEFDRFFKDSIDSNGALVIIDKKNGKIIGSSRFKKVDLIENAVEIGWTFLSRKYWGGKYNISLKLLMIDYAFTFFEDVIFYVSQNNIRSQKAIEKLGAKKTNEIKFYSNTANNDLIYRINKNDWKVQKSHLPDNVKKN